MSLSALSIPRVSGPDRDAKLVNSSDAKLFIHSRCVEAESEKDRGVGDKGGVGGLDLVVLTAVAHDTETTVTTRYGQNPKSDDKNIDGIIGNEAHNTTETTLKNSPPSVNAEPSTVENDTDDDEDRSNGDFMIYLCITLVVIIFLLIAFFIGFSIRRRIQKLSILKVEENLVYGMCEDYYKDGKIREF